MTHYTSFPIPGAMWAFTSPVGRHGDFASKSLCTDVARKTRKKHEEMSEQDGAFNKILRDYFDPEPMRP